MYAKRLMLLGLVIPVFAACRDTQTPTALPTDSPRFSSAGSPKFTDWSATGPDAFGTLSTSFRMTGVGSNASSMVTASANGNAVWGCQTGSQTAFDLYPAPETRAGVVSTSSGSASKNGQITGSVFVPSSAAAIRCHPAHTLRLLSTAFTGVQLSQPDAGAQAIPGTFSLTYFTLPTEPAPPPTITDLTVGATTFTLGGGAPDVVTLTVTVHNPGDPVSGVVVQLWFRQGTAFRAGGGQGVFCGGAVGVVPTGDCTVSLTTLAGNQYAGIGTLVPGAATFEVYLEKDNIRRVLDGRVVNVTLQ